MSGAPRAVYERLLAGRAAEVARLTRVDARYALLRLLAAGAAAAAAWLAFASGVVHPAWILPPAGLFLALVAGHDRAVSARRRAARSVAFFEKCLARLDDRPGGGGDPGERFLDDGHPFAADLDLFGRGSLFARINTARTRAGEATLAAWLTAPAGPGEIRARQEAIEELRGRVDLREDLAVLGEEIRAEVHADAIARWSAAPPVLENGPARAAAAALSVAAAAGLAAWLAGILPPAPFAAVIAAEALLGLALRERVRRVVGAVETPGRDLALLAEILARLEKEAFRSAKLAGLRGALDAAGEPPSRAVARLARRIVLLDSRRNQLFALLAPLLMWTTQVAFALEAWRRRYGPEAGGWLAALGELEALGALAGRAFEHPEDIFPEIAAGGALFEAEGIAHPLIPEGRCVRNDVALGDGRRLLIVSGSNMSGKSTLLRSVGANAVLAWAGAPVRARRMRLSVMALGATLRVQDSLQAGTSRFYAEITRLKSLSVLAKGPRPLLFLLDEILHGTNSHDRRIGAEAIVRGFVASGAIGLVTTHDLALARIAEDAALGAANVHFEDRLEEGRMSFDYRLRPGVVERSNAIELMRAVGLEV